MTSHIFPVTHNFFDTHNSLLVILFSWSLHPQDIHIYISMELSSGSFHTHHPTPNNSNWYYQRLPTHHQQPHHHHVASTATPSNIVSSTVVQSAITQLNPSSLFHRQHHLEVITLTLSKISNSDIH